MALSMRKTVQKIRNLLSTSPSSHERNVYEESRHEVLGSVEKVSIIPPNLDWFDEYDDTESLYVPYLPLASRYEYSSQRFTKASSCTESSLSSISYSSQRFTKVSSCTESSLSSISYSSQRFTKVSSSADSSFRSDISPLYFPDSPTTSLYPDSLHTSTTTTTHYDWVYDEQDADPFAKGTVQIIRKSFFQPPPSPPPPPLPEREPRICGAYESKKLPPLPNVEEDSTSCMARSSSESSISRPTHRRQPSPFPLLNTPQSSSTTAPVVPPWGFPISHSAPENVYLRETEPELDVEEYFPPSRFSSDSEFSISASRRGSEDDERKARYTARSTLSYFGGTMRSK